MKIFLMFLALSLALGILLRNSSPSSRMFTMLMVSIAMSVIYFFVSRAV